MRQTSGYTAGGLDCAEHLALNRLFTADLRFTIKGFSAPALERR